MDAVTLQFNKAVHENNAQERIKLLIKGCTILTHIIPVKSQVPKILEQKDQLKYLLLSQPLNTPIINNILLAVIDTLYDDSDFIDVFQRASECISVMKDTLEISDSRVKKQSSSYKRKKSSLKKMFLTNKSDKNNFEMELAGS